MKTWSNPGFSVTPNANIFEDHAIDYMQTLNGMGDNTEYFLSCTTNMVHAKEEIRTSSGTTTRSTSLNIGITIKHHTQRYTR